jgi:hypothetical protein
MNCCIFTIFTYWMKMKQVSVPRFSVVLILLFSSLIFAQQEQPVPYERIKNRLQEEMRANAERYQWCIDNVLVPDQMAPDEPHMDSIQVYGDCMNTLISPIKVNQSGYLPNDPLKEFYYVGSASSFEVIDENGEVISTGNFSSAGGSIAEPVFEAMASNWAGGVGGADVKYTMSATGAGGVVQVGNIPDGLDSNQNYRIRVGSDVSADFAVHSKVYTWVRSALVKFMGINRSGDSESWFHPPSHTLDEIQGGWYDCGDHLKEAPTQSYALAMLGLVAAVYKDRDADFYAYNQGNTINTDGVGDILREAKHGADFVIESYNHAGGEPSAMITSVGSFGYDHLWWGQPQFQDVVPTNMGGAPRESRNDIGANILARYAAGTAFVGALYKELDPNNPYGQQAIDIAKDIYAYAVADIENVVQTMAYQGENTSYDDLILAAIALLWATEDEQYKFDLVENTALGTGQTELGRGAWASGLMAHENNAPLHQNANTGWARVETPAIWAFYKLLLRQPEDATRFGFSPDERLAYTEDLLYDMVANLSFNADPSGAATALPRPGILYTAEPQLKADPLFGWMYVEQEWVANRYQFGNITDVFVYWDIAREVGGVAFPDAGTQDWKSDDAYVVLMKQLNYMLGMNPWDISMIVGIGDKNFNHAHHRAANPEGKNVPGAFYEYRYPVGALYGSTKPENNFLDYWERFQLTEVCIDGIGASIIPIAGMSAEEDLLAPPAIQVIERYVGYESAIFEVRLDRLGTAQLNLGTTPDARTDTRTPTPNESAVLHRFELEDLQPSTTYYLTATGWNTRSGLPAESFWVDSTQTPYSFTTLSTPPAAADIQNVKVCSITASDAEIMWFTPNGEYESTIYWDTVLTSAENMRWSASGDESGAPTRFHRMTATGLQEQTTYYYVVESDGEQRAVDTLGRPLQFTTPVTQVDFTIRTHTYDKLGSDDVLSIAIVNDDPQEYDSLELHIFMRAPENVNVGGRDVAFEDHFAFTVDIAFNFQPSGHIEGGFTDYLYELVRASRPIKLADTWDASTQTFAYYIPIPLGSTVMRTGSRIRMDVMQDSRSPYSPFEDLMNALPVSRPVRSSLGDYHPLEWSYAAHSVANGDPVDYPGMPRHPKDYLDNFASLVPVNQYIAVYRKGEFIWGFSPSYSQMVNRRADYELTLDLNWPFSLPDGSHVRIDTTTTRFYARGTASVTNGGWINDIWVNGERLENIYEDEIVVRNSTTGSFDLNIPVRMHIGSNPVDITIFAGNDPQCTECNEGGCDFENRHITLDITKGDRTESDIRIMGADGNPVESPADPNNTSFNIFVRDEDNLDQDEIYVWVINSRRDDSIQVTLVQNTQTGEFETENPVRAATSGGDIAFYGGDTIVVRYIDAGDEEDISELSFFANITYPIPEEVVALDPYCLGRASQIRITFSQAFTAQDRMDTIWVSLRDPDGIGADSFFVMVEDDITNQAVLTLDLPEGRRIPETTAPAGYIAAFIQPDGAPRSQERADIIDSIPPTMIGFSLLENEDPRVPEDTMMVGFSEPVDIPEDQWIFSVFDTLGGNPIDITSLEMVGPATTENEGRSWLFAVTGNDSGDVIRDGYAAQIREGITVRDMRGNQLDRQGCNNEVPIIEVPKPVPVKIAEMRDTDGDSYPDELYMLFEKHLRPKDMLDSFVVNWGTNPIQEVSFLPAEDLAGTDNPWNAVDSVFTRVEAVDSVTNIQVEDSMSIVILPIVAGDFVPGSTNGFQNGKGFVIPRLGPKGGFFDTDYPVADVVGPRIMEARLTKARDSLTIMYSEPLEVIEGGGSEIQKKTGETSTLDLMPFISVPTSDIDWLHYFEKGEAPETNVRVGDLIRMTPDNPKFNDLSANKPGEQNPWVEIKGSMSGEVGINIVMLDTVTHPSREDVEEAYAAEIEYVTDSLMQFRVSFVDNLSGNEVVYGRYVNGARLGDHSRNEYSQNDWIHVGPTFDAEISIPAARLSKYGNYIWAYTLSVDFQIYDNLGQFINTLGIKDLKLTDEMRERFINSDGVLTIRVEWILQQPKGSGLKYPNAPAAVDGRMVSNGAFIVASQLEVEGEYKVDDEPEILEDGTEVPPEFEVGDKTNHKDDDVATFGYMRP